MMITFNKMARTNQRNAAPPEESKVVTVPIVGSRVLRVSRVANEVCMTICFDGDETLLRGMQAVHVPLAKLPAVTKALHAVAGNGNGKKKNGQQRTAAKRYFTGRPCSRGHVAARLVSTNTCVVCAREKARQWRAKNRDQYRANHRAGARPRKRKRGAGRRPSAKSGDVSVGGALWPRWVCVGRSPTGRPGSMWARYMPT